ncbi:hypothetical protein WJX72_010366 [[Myrmecia] bisecta]|uniref:Uncharacterized protein n=1 Tax=[Myrmecia] bisecta TaxID=41462 RepID=A0AAW1PH96_9CHLO
MHASHKPGGCCLGRTVSGSTWRTPHRGSWQQVGAGRYGFACQASTSGVQATVEAGGLAPVFDAEAGADALCGPAEKLCEGCTLVRSLVEFTPVNITVDGHHYLCRACTAERTAARYPDKKGNPHPKGPKSQEASGSRQPEYY